MYGHKFPLSIAVSAVEEKTQDEARLPLNRPTNKMAPRSTGIVSVCTDISSPSRAPNPEDGEESKKAVGGLKVKKEFKCRPG